MDTVEAPTDQLQRSGNDATSFIALTQERFTRNLPIWLLVLEAGGGM